MRRFRSMHETLSVALCTHTHHQTNAERVQKKAFVSVKPLEGLGLLSVF
jgi:hypothetical protein